MRSKRSAVVDQPGYREVLQALELAGEHLEQTLSESIEKIDQMLEEDQHHLPAVQSFARESVVKVPAGHLVIKCNERLERLIEQVKEEALSFTEHAEEMRRLIDLNLVRTSAAKWKAEVLHWQGEISSDQMHLLNYYRDRSEIAARMLEQPQISDVWIELVELDEDCFFKLRSILFHLRLFTVRLALACREMQSLSTDAQ